MGAVLQTAGAAELVAELTCCAATSVCGLVTRDGATRAKFRYCSFLLLATVTCVILLIPGLRTKLDKIPNLCGKTVTKETCDKFVGFSAVYRILISITMFHFLLSLSTIGVTRVKSFRAKFNNGLWLFKMALIFGLTIGSFYIPRKTGFFRWWMYISLTGGFMFVMFQIILVIDFGHSWSLSWAEKLETSNTKCWYLAMAMVTLLMFSMSFGAIISFYYFFTHPPQFLKCQANLFYITFIGIQCFLAALISITPAVQQELSGAGLLQSSVVILYTMYLTWNTLSSEPDSTCNPLGNIILEYDSLTGVSGEAIFGCLLTLVLLIFACTVRANTSHLGKYGLALAESETFALATYNEDVERENVEKRLESGEKEVSLEAYVGYNYSFFHIVMALASLHILMVLTNWHSPDEHADMKKLIKNWASVWVQMASSFVCLLVYIWFLVTPLVKRVWGPMFGVFMDESYVAPPSSKHVQPHPSNKPGLETTKSQNLASPENTQLTKSALNEFEKQMEQRLESRNSYVPQKAKVRRLKRVGSEESLASAVSVLSNMTSATQRKAKRRNKLLTVPETEDDEDAGSIIRKKIIIPKKFEKHEITRARHTKQNNLNKEMYSSSESLSSRVSNYVKKQSSNLRRTPSIQSEERFITTAVSMSRENVVDNEKQEIINEEISVNYDVTETKTNSVVVDSAATLKRKNKDHEKRKRKRDREPKPTGLIEQNKVTTITDKHRPEDATLEEPSLVPSVFQRQPQKPNTAKAILELQWKILRTQAKVVKIQERIIRLQAEADLNADDGAPPVEQSSFINSKRFKLKNNIHTKEFG